MINWDVATSDADVALPRHRINSVARAANILLAISRSEQGLTVREISDSLHLERQTTYHLVHTLAALNLISRDERRRYRLGLRVGALSEAFQRQFSAPDYLRPLVRDLAAASGETCYAVGWWQGEIVTLAVTRGTAAVQTAEVPHGQYGDAHARAAGKLLLAFAPFSRRSEYIKRHPLRQRTPNTITEIKRLDLEFVRIRQQEFAVDNEEFSAGVCCLAVPLERGGMPYALALSSPAERFRKSLDTYLNDAQHIARHLGQTNISSP